MTYGQKNKSAEKNMFHSQTRVAPIIPRIGPMRGVKVRKREIINRMPSRKVLWTIKISFKASVTALI